MSNTPRHIFPTPLPQGKGGILCPHLKECVQNVMQGSEFLLTHKVGNYSDHDDEQFWREQMERWGLLGLTIDYPPVMLDDNTKLRRIELHRLAQRRDAAENGIRLWAKMWLLPHRQLHPLLSQDAWKLMQVMWKDQDAETSRNLEHFLIQIRKNMDKLSTTASKPEKNGMEEKMIVMNSVQHIALKVYREHPANHQHQDDVVVNDDKVDNIEDFIKNIRQLYAATTPGRRQLFFHCLLETTARVCKTFGVDILHGTVISDDADADGVAMEEETEDEPVATVAGALTMVELDDDKEGDDGSENKTMATEDSSSINLPEGVASVDSSDNNNENVNTNNINNKKKKKNKGGKKKRGKNGGKK